MTNILLKIIVHVQFKQCNLMMATSFWEWLEMMQPWMQLHTQTRWFSFMLVMMQPWKQLHTLIRWFSFILAVMSTMQSWKQLHSRIACFSCSLAVISIKSAVVILIGLNYFNTSNLWYQGIRSPWTQSSHTFCRWDDHKTSWNMWATWEREQKPPGTLFSLHQHG